MTTSKMMLAAAALAVAATFGFAEKAAAYPDKPVNYIIPFGPGGESDITARYQQPFFKKKFGQDLVVSYKPGGGGAVGWAQLNDMKGDGYTIMGMNLPHIIIKPAQKDVGFKTKDITSVYIFQYTPDAIIVKRDSPFKTLQDLIDFAKANPPGRLTLAGSGKGSANHLLQVRFSALAGIKSAYVAMKGTGATVQAILGGQVEGGSNYSTAGAKYEANIRLLAIATEKRHPRFPDVPTFRELGFDIVTGAFRGVAVPKSASESVRKAVSDAMEAMNKDPEFIKKMMGDGFALVDVPYPQSLDFIAEKSKFYLKLAKDAGIIK